MNEIRHRGYDIARDSIRREQLVSTRAAMELVPDVLGSLAVDRQAILKRIEDELRKPTANPLNAVLGIFGLRIIRTESTISTIDGKLENMTDVKVADVASGDASDFIRLDEEALAGAVDAIARKLRELEDSEGRTKDYLREQNDALHAELESRERTLAQLRTDFQDQLKTVAERAQYILSFYRQGNADAMADQLTELLTDLDLKAVWRAELQDSDSPDAMFVSFRYSGTEKRREKPCILHDGQVLMKGVVFVTDESVPE